MEGGEPTNVAWRSLEEGQDKNVINRTSSKCPDVSLSEKKHLLCSEELWRSGTRSGIFTFRNFT